MTNNAALLDRLTGKQLSRGLGGFGGQQANHEPAMCPATIRLLCFVTIRLRWFLPLFSTGGIDVPSAGLPSTRETRTIMEKVQRRTTKIIQEFEHLSHQERLRELGWFGLEKKSSGGSSWCAQIPVNTEPECSRWCPVRTWSNGPEGTNRNSHFKN